MTKTRRRRGGRLKNATLKAEKEAKRAQRKAETQILKDVKAQKIVEKAILIVKMIHILKITNIQTILCKTSILFRL